MKTQEAPQVFTGSPDFPVEFADPTDAELTWEWDDMHWPQAMTPLAADFGRYCIGAGLFEWAEMFGGPRRMLTRVWNGWAYFAPRWMVAEEDREAADARWTEVHRSRIPLTKALWNGEILPELKSMFEAIETISVDGLSGEDLAAAWLGAWAKASRAWVLHFVSIMGPYQVLEDLADAYNAAMGGGRDREAMELIGGGHHELEDVDEGIEALVALGREEPLRSEIEAVSSASAVTEPIDLDRLRRIPGGPAFVDELERFLARHGHLGQNHDDMTQASWAQAPRLVLGRIALRFRATVEPTRLREAALGARSEELANAVRAALADKPDELAHFEEVLAHARDIAYLTEGHNYWIDRLSQARMRELSLRVGARLVREGVLAEPEDVFFLSRDEVADAVRDGQRRLDLVAERRHDHARNQQRTPPQHVGRIPSKPEAGDRFDGLRGSATQADQLTGVGASAGVVRGPARVTLSQDDFGRIQPGDIIVCPSSNPSWVPVFTIAGGLITNTGGVLSHAAVVAREFGLPAVVGTGDATTKIPDGRLVEIDGTAGTVRLL
jgi:rifampicin phosphotransferase